MTVEVKVKVKVELWGKVGVERLGEGVISRRVIPSRRERLSMPAAL